jgi:hypothetical protein
MGFVMALSHSNAPGRLTLVDYCLRVFYAIAVIAVGLKIVGDHWPL